MPTSRVIHLNFEDPTVFAKCSGRCNKTGPGTKTIDIYYKAYTKRLWARQPVCENCGSSMVMLYEVKE